MFLTPTIPFATILWIIYASHTHTHHTRRHTQNCGAWHAFIYLYVCMLYLTYEPNIIYKIFDVQRTYTYYPRAHMYAYVYVQCDPLHCSVVRIYWIIRIVHAHIYPQNTNHPCIQRRHTIHSIQWQCIVLYSLYWMDWEDRKRVCYVVPYTKHKTHTLAHTYNL